LFASQRLRTAVNLALPAILIWVALQFLVTVVLIFFHIDKVENNIASYAQSLERLAVSRNSQNFGFMQSLTMVADAPRSRSIASFTNLAENLHARYPQISGIAWYEMEPDEKVRLKPIVQVPTERESPILKSAKLLEALGGHHGQVQVVVDSKLQNKYYIIEHVRNYKNHFSVIITIDSREMLKPSLVDNCPKVTWTSGELTLFSNVSTKRNNSLILSTIERRIEVYIGDIYQKPNDNFLKTSINVEKPIALDAIFDNSMLYVFSTFSILIAGLSSYALHQGQVTRRLREAERLAKANINRLELEKRHEHASRVYAIGEMAAAIAHELIQPLTAILINSQTGVKLMDAMSTPQTNVTSILSSNVKDAQRASEIIRNVRSFVSPKPTDTACTDIIAAIREVATLMEALFAECGFELALDFDEEPLLCKIGRVEFEQVVYNLVRNALEVGEHLDAEDRIVAISARRTDNRISIRVRDRGPGIEEIMLQNLFVPFSTTKVSGMGLGLSLSRRIVERAGGELSGKNHQGRGAIFEIVLPKATSGIASSNRRQPATADEAHVTARQSSLKVVDVAVARRQPKRPRSSC